MNNSNESDAVFFQTVIENVTRSNAEARCLFYGRGGFYPGFEHVVVESFYPYLIIKCYQPQLTFLDSPERYPLLDVLEAQGYRALLVQHAYRQATSGPAMEAKWESLWGEEIPDAGFELVVEERGLKYRIVLGKNRNTGLFLDMAVGRQWVAEHSRQAKVLNLFAYTCGFSVAAKAGGAISAVNVDMSKGMLKWGQKNHALNSSHESVQFFSHNIMQSWGKLKRLAPFDLIIADPPSFQKGSFNVTTDYRKVIKRMNEVVADSGKILACLNSPHLESSFLLEQFEQEAPELKYCESLSPGEDFKDTQPERGLKMMVFEKQTNRH